MQAMAGKQLQNWSSLENEGHLNLKVSANANMKIEDEGDAHDQNKRASLTAAARGIRRGRIRGEKYLFHLVMLKKTQSEGKQRRHFLNYTN